MLFTLGHWHASYRDNRGKTVVFFIASDTEGESMKAESIMQRFGVSDIVSVSLSSFDRVHEYAERYFKLSVFELSPFPVSHEQEK